MILPVLALTHSHLSRQSTYTVELSRGASLYGCPGIPNYQDVEDTSLEQAHPDALHGGDYTLLGGPGRTILLRFGSLAAVLGPNVKVTDAKLVLTMTSPDHPTLRAVSIVKKPWGEGPFQLLPMPPKLGAVPPKVSPDRYGATWRVRQFGISESNWGSPGAQSDQDATPIAGVTSDAQGSEFRIGGLGASVQAMLADPGANNGFAVTFESTPEFVSSEAAAGKPKLVLTCQRVEPPTGADLAVVGMIPDGSHWLAAIRNVGKEPASDAKGEVWVDAGSPNPVVVPATIDPGQAVQVELNVSPAPSQFDGRSGAITFRLHGSPNDHNLADKQLTVTAGAVPILVTPPTTDRASLLSPRGQGLDNWIQAQLDVVNDIYLARSRYSFAPSGCYRRVRLYVQGSAGATPRAAGTVAMGSDPQPIDLPFIRQVLALLGAPDWSKTDLPRSDPAVTALGSDVGGVGPFPDVSGGGDTRYEGGLPSQVILPQVAATITDAVLEPSGLLSASTVAALNASGEGKQAAAKALVKFPNTVFIDASDSTGRPLKTVDLAFYQLHGDQFDQTPAFTLKTSENGSAQLPKRPAQGGTPNPFGSLDLVRDGAYLIKATSNGESAWAWLHAWQLTDAAFRGDTSFASIPLQFNLANASVDRTQNLALNRAITDSAGSFPAKLASLVDGQGQSGVALPQKPGDWIEVDLNRDWTLSELRLTADGAPWNAFQIMVYQTGQKDTQAVEWVSEPDWNWSVQNHGVAASKGQSVAYHGPAVQIRYIRIKCVRPGSGQLLKIEAFSSKGS